MSDIFQEIDEDLRRDRLAGLWRRYGTAVVAVSLAALLGVGGYIAWRDYTESKLDTNAEALAAAAQLLTENKPADAAKAFSELADSAGGPYADLARLNAATALLGSGDAAGAVTAYDKVAAESRDTSVAALARVLAVEALIDMAPVADLDARLDAIGDAAGFAPAVKELRAYVRLKAGATDESRRLLAEVIDDTAAPSRLKARAQEVLEALGGRLVPVATTPTEQQSQSEGQRP